MKVKEIYLFYNEIIEYMEINAFNYQIMKYQLNKISIN